MYFSLFPCYILSHSWPKSFGFMPCNVIFFPPQNSFSSVSLLYVSKSINQFQPISALNLEVGEPRSSWRRKV